MTNAEHSPEQLVRVLHHRFSASPRLLERLEAFQKPEFRGKRQIRIMGTRIVGLELIRYNASHYDPMIRFIERGFVHHNQAIKLSAARLTKPSEGGERQLKMKPTDQPSFDGLLSGLRMSDDLINQGPANHYAYVRFRPDELLDDAGLESALEDLDIDSVASDLKPLEITGYDWRLRAPDPNRSTYQPPLPNVS